MKIRSHELSARKAATAMACILAASALGGCVGKEESNNDREAGPPPARVALQQTARAAGKYLVEHETEAKANGKLIQQKGIVKLAGHLKMDDLGIFFERKTPKGTELDVEAAMELGADGKPDPSTTYYLGLNSLRLPKDNSKSAKGFHLDIEGVGKADSEWGASLRKTNESTILHLFIDGERSLTPDGQDALDEVLPRLQTAIAG